METARQVLAGITNTNLHALASSSTDNLYFTLIIRTTSIVKWQSSKQIKNKSNQHDANNTTTQTPLKSNIRLTMMVRVKLRGMRIQ